jgi:hypothetical protein
VVGFVQQEEFGPVNDGQKPKTGMRACPLQKGVVDKGEQGEDSGPVSFDLFEQ